MALHTNAMTRIFKSNEMSAKEHTVRIQTKIQVTAWLD